MLVLPGMVSEVLCLGGRRAVGAVLLRRDGVRLHGPSEPSVEGPVGRVRLASGRLESPVQPDRHVFSSIASFDALLSAYRRARRAGRTHPGATGFDFDLESNLIDLEEELLAARYRPGAYRSFFVHEPKRRLVSAAPFRDRVVHHALVGALEPLFERRFIHDSYACRRGKGTHQAVCRAHQFAGRYRFCLSTDVVRFFPSVDHELLLGTVRRVVRCRRTLALMKAILDGGKDVLRSEFPDTLFPGDDPR